MDWLDEIVEKLKTRANQLSLKKALMVYIAVCVIIVAVLTYFTQTFCTAWDDYIRNQYLLEEPGESENQVYSYYDPSILSSMDKVLVEVIDFLQTWSTIFYSIIAIFGISYLFYNNKLRQPLEILKEVTDKVGRNDLELDLYYDNKDEMGDLCRSFDMMRKKLIENNQKMWDMMEEQKRLNAAFAHDLRTPLTVLRGYTDLLREYFPEGKISQEKLLVTLSMMSEQINRLENYSNTMKEINSLEELPLKRVSVKPDELEKKLREVCEVLNGKNGIHIKLFNSVFDNRTELFLDKAFVMEAFENLMSNALRYANAEIEVILSLSEDGKQLLLSVADDGKGFSKTDFIMATKPYYTESKEPGSKHFGIGLYICKILCEKHQGGLILENKRKQGAIITATFLVQC